MNPNDPLTYALGEIANGSPAAPGAAGLATRHGEPKFAAKPAPTLRPIEPYKPFPADALPSALGKFVRETAHALGCDAAHVALPTLAATAAAVGTTRMIELKPTWREYAILWVADVARSGTLKTPAFKAAIGPVYRAQAEAAERHQQRVAAHTADKTRHDIALRAWRENGANGDPPLAPAPPTMERLMVSDATLEALAPILKANERGVLLARDELAAWLHGFDQYKAGGRGADSAAWLELWQGGTLIVDRKTGEPRTIIVPRAACSICGTIQPGTLAKALRPDYFESGLAARLLLVAPPDREKVWSDDSPSKATLDAYHELLHALRGLMVEPDPRDENQVGPVVLRLHRDAYAMWVSWYNVHAARIRNADDDRRAAALAKLEAYGARFALLFTLADDPHARLISGDAMRRGTLLADWFADEAERVYAMLGESGEARELRRLVEWIERRGCRVTLHDLTHGLRRYRNDPDRARADLGALERASIGHWTYPAPGPYGGRPTPRFELDHAVTDTETNGGATVARGIGDGDAGDVGDSDSRDSSPPADADAGWTDSDRPPLSEEDAAAAAAENSPRRSDEGT